MKQQKIILSVIFFLVSQLILAGTKTSSVLAQGDWYKIAVSTSGVYKIDKNFLNDLGINVNKIDPKNIQIFGNGGKMLPQSLAESRYDDLEENAITVVGEEDASFDDGDYILFYAEGPHVLNANTSTKQFSHTYNVYSDNAYYFLTVGETQGKRVSTTSNPSTSSQTITSFTEYAFHEKDEYSIIISGREWFGEKFDNFTTTQTVSLPITDIIDQASIKIQTVAKATKQSPKFSISLNNESLGNISIGVSSSGYGTKARSNTTVYQKAITSSSASFKFTYNNNGDADSKGYLNYIGINYLRKLRLSGSQLTFSSFESLKQNESKFSIENASNSIVWEITNPIQVSKQVTTLENSMLNFNATTDVLKRFVVFTANNLTSPTSIGKVENQNLHGMTDVPTMLIVTHSDFLGIAQDFADYKTKEKGILTKVVLVNQIYNEFSSGAQDITAIRDMAKMLYDRNANFKYLLLFGDASYDYKNRIKENTNYVPTYQAYESMDDIKTYASDDYFGFLEDTEGRWSESGGNHTLDIGVGRFPIQTVEQATGIINKIKNYHNKELYGNWKNEITLVADDGDDNLHMKDANSLASDINQKFSQYNINKIYLDAFVQTSSAQGETSKTASEEINRQLDRGTFIVNYTGHGGEIGWTQEQILTVPQINGWTNKQLPLFVTATCEFGRYDDPVRISGAEYTLINPNGGAIAIISTTRPVYASSNKQLNDEFYKAVFLPNKDGSMPTLGEVMIATKNNSLNGVYNRNFSLLGDPSLTLAYPKEQIKITHINQETSIGNDTIRALEKVEMSGEIQLFDGTLSNTFDGKILIKIYDKSTTITSFGNEESPYTFDIRNSILYQGQASVKKGKFSFTFVVPKDISYQLGEGKVSLYAIADDELKDGTGFKTDLIVGEGKKDVVIDNEPPILDLFMNDRTFINGGKTAKNARLIADIYDDNGVNLTNTGIGHEITIIIDGDFNNRYIANPYYTGNLDDYQRGVIDFPLYDLSDGEHTAELKVWDTHNNSSTKTITFYVGDQISLSNYPNPFQNETNFTIDHGRAGENLEIELIIYSSTGQLVKTILQNFEESPSVISELKWDGTNDSGGFVAKGIYFYHLNLYYPFDGKTISAIEKLVITH